MNLAIDLRGFSPCAFLVALLCAGCGLLAGCGGATATGSGSTGTISTKGTIADLRGGWLIAGTMPLSSVVGSGSYPFGLVLNLDVINGEVTGYGSMQLPCAISGTLTGAVGNTLRLQSSTVAADGTFTLTDTVPASSTAHQVVVQGTIPAVAGGVWSGTYTLSAPLANCNGVVPPTQAGMFTTQKVADLDGTFAGQGTLNASSTPATVTASFTQGGPANPNGNAYTPNDQNELNGTLQVQGLSCFKSGTMQTAGGYPTGDLLGNQVGAEFVMDDGSTVLLSGTESNTSASTLVSVSLLVNGGACDKTFVSLTTAVKQ